MHFFLDMCGVCSMSSTETCREIFLDDFYVLDVASMVLTRRTAQVFNVLFFTLHVTCLKSHTPSIGSSFQRFNTPDVFHICYPGSIEKLKLFGALTYFGHHVKWVHCSFFRRYEYLDIGNDTF